MAGFLSEDHMTTGSAALNGDAGFQGAMTNVDLGLQFNVADAPEGSIDYYLSQSSDAGVETPNRKFEGNWPYSATQLLPLKKLCGMSSCCSLMCPDP